jgi:hypothetical protein
LTPRGTSRPPTPSELTPCIASAILLRGTMKSWRLAVMQT